MLLRPGDRVPPLSMRSLRDEVLAVPVPGVLVHLQFRRFAGCPVCSLHLRDVVRRLDELRAAGIVEIAVFHSSADALRPHFAGSPLHVVADPDKQLYRRFGVETSPRALLDPRAWRAVARGLAATTHRSLRAEGGRLGLPADILLGPDGCVLACKYGRHADDQWSVDQVLALARVDQPHVTHGRGIEPARCVP